MKTSSLHEYRLRYPDVAAYPTLVQNRELAGLLGRLSEKQTARKRRDAQWRALLATLSSVGCRIRTALQQSGRSRPVTASAHAVTRRRPAHA